MDFEKELKAKKLKVTPQRIAILKEIKCSGHISIEDIYERIKKSYPSTSLATVYKNVTMLYDMSILRSIKTHGQKQKYELNLSKHIHVTCEKCGRLEDIYVDFSSLQNNCMQVSGYRLNDLSAVFSGICPSCRKLESMGIAIHKDNDFRGESNSFL